MIAFFHRARVHIHVFRLLRADLFNSIVHVFGGDFGIVIRHFDFFVIFQLDFGDHLECGLKAQRLALVQVDVGDGRRPHHVEVFRLELLLQMLGDELFEHFLPYVAGVILANHGSRRFAGTKALELRTLLHVGRDAGGFAFYFLNGY